MLVAAAPSSAAPSTIRHCHFLPDNFDRRIARRFREPRDGVATGVGARSVIAEQVAKVK